MTDQPTLFDVPAVAPTLAQQADAAPTIHPPVDAWFRPGSTTPATHAARVLRGLHPFGRPLSQWPGAKCGNCRHAVLDQEQSKSFWKCATDVRAWTAGPGTDLRLGWRGCERWAPGLNGRVTFVYRGDPPAGAEQLPPGPYRYVVRDGGERLRWLVPAWYRPVPGMPIVALPEVAVHLMHLADSPELVEVAEAGGAPMRVSERVLTHCIMTEELAPTEDHARVALALLVEVVGARKMEAYPAARLLLAAVEAGVSQAKRAMEKEKSCPA